MTPFRSSFGIRCNPISAICHSLLGIEIWNFTEVKETLTMKNREFQTVYRARARERIEQTIVCVVSCVVAALMAGLLSDNIRSGNVFYILFCAIALIVSLGVFVQWVIGWGESRREGR